MRGVLVLCGVTTAQHQDTRPGAERVRGCCTTGGSHGRSYNPPRITVYVSDTRRASVPLACYTVMVLVSVLCYALWGRYQIFQRVAGCSDDGGIIQQLVSQCTRREQRMNQKAVQTTVAGARVLPEYGMSSGKVCGARVVILETNVSTCDHPPSTDYQENNSNSSSVQQTTTWLVLLGFGSE
ncbi:hypothetical protein CBL_00907 [Carabus blaptoides fortunei]